MNVCMSMVLVHRINAQIASFVLLVCMYHELITLATCNSVTPSLSAATAIGCPLGVDRILGGWGGSSTKGAHRLGKNYGSWISQLIMT